MKLFAFLYSIFAGLAASVTAMFIDVTGLNEADILLLHAAGQTGQEDDADWDDDE